MITLPPYFNFTTYPFTGQKTDFFSAGSNHRGVLIVYQEEGMVNDFLSKVMAAVKLDLATDTTLVPYQSGLTFYELKQRLPNTTYLLSFGVQPSELSLHLRLKPYQIQAFMGVELLFADPVSILLEDKTKKTHLWGALQKLFPTVRKST